MSVTISCSISWPGYRVGPCRHTVAVHETSSRCVRNHATPHFIAQSILAQTVLCDCFQPVLNNYLHFITGAYWSHLVGSGRASSQRDCKEYMTNQAHRYFIRLEAVAIRLEAIASRLEAITSRVGWRPLLLFLLDTFTVYVHWAATIIHYLTIPITKVSISFQVLSE